MKSETTTVSNRDESEAPSRDPVPVRAACRDGAIATLWRNSSAGGAGGSIGGSIRDRRREGGTCLQARGL